MGVLKVAAYSSNIVGFLLKSLLVIYIVSGALLSEVLMYIGS
jgi:hypothetical protein